MIPASLRERLEAEVLSRFPRKGEGENHASYNTLMRYEIRYEIEEALDLLWQLLLSEAPKFDDKLMNATLEKHGFCHTGSFMAARICLLAYHQQMSAQLAAMAALVDDLDEQKVWAAGRITELEDLVLAAEKKGYAAREAEHAADRKLYHAARADGTDLARIHSELERSHFLQAKRIAELEEKLTEAIAMRSAQVETITAERAKAERYRAALEDACSTIHSEFCGEKCHQLCIRPTKALEESK